ncbi:MAG TPA: hypothetical protein VFQ61_24140 [Polyangiaceae bacterium]|nr:hypothetical protein [Polyangiaceae bacterium]
MITRITSHLRPPEPAAAPFCAVYRECGGCPLIGLSSAEQRAKKTEQLMRTMHAQGVPCDAPAWVSDGRVWGYRNRLRLRFDQGRPVFFNANKDPSCSVLRPELRELIPRVAEWAGPRQAALSAFEHLEVRAPDVDGLGALAIYSSERVTRPRGTMGPLGLQSSSHLTESEPLEAPPGMLLAQPGHPVPMQRFHWTVDIVNYVPVTSFMQVNSGVNDLLIREIQELALSCGARTALDLYSGTGNFSLALLAAGLNVTSVEMDGLAFAGYRRALTERGEQLSGAVCDVSEAANRLLDSGAAYDLVIANPPRAGLGKAAPRCASLSRTHFVLCCCRAESFARDARVLTQSGLQLVRLMAFDMFPGTEHLEVLGFFSRS